VDIGVALPFRDLGARRGGRSAPSPGRFTPGKDPVPIVQEAGWAAGPVWTCAKNLAPTRIRSPDHPARSTKLIYDSDLFTKQRVTLLFGQTVSSFRHLSQFPADMCLYDIFPTISPWIRINTVEQCAETYEVRRLPVCAVMQYVTKLPTFFNILLTHYS
jgi:hypothetical protein